MQLYIWAFLFAIPTFDLVSIQKPSELISVMPSSALEGQLELRSSQSPRSSGYLVFTLGNAEFHKADTEVSLVCMHIWSLNSHAGGCHLLFTQEEMKAFLQLRWPFREAPVEELQGWDLT